MAYNVDRLLLIPSPVPFQYPPSVWWGSDLLSIGALVVLRTNLFEEAADPVKPVVWPILGEDLRGDADLRSQKCASKSKHRRCHSNASAGDTFLHVKKLALINKRFLDMRAAEISRPRQWFLATVKQS